MPPLTSPDESTRHRRFSTSLSTKRMTGRPSMPSSSSSRISPANQGGMDEFNVSSDTSATQHHRGEGHHPHHRHVQQQHDRLLIQVSEWLQKEKAKRAARKSAKRLSKEQELEGLNLEGDASQPSLRRTSSQSSDSSAFSLEKLQRILEDNMTGYGQDSLPSTSPSLGPRRPSHPRRGASSKRGFQSSDTEYQDGDVVVPSCDVMLDNSKTLSYSGGSADSSTENVTLSTSKRAEKEKKAWLAFKSEILRLAHTLRLKGWRRVPLERGGDIEVERLSGALTNAVYVVSPPAELPLTSNTNSSTPHKPRPPQKLLLRIYGPQVEHLIDRENELGILRRLARKKIGPRLLGTFRNGRFEEYFNAQTLKSEDLRDSATSKQIAKRMRELHEGIELLEREREEGPFVWRNWDKWVDRCEEVIRYLDKEILSGKKRRGESWRERGLVCGVEWKVFKSAVDKYRKWLDEYYREKGGVMNNLVFAHNDVCLPSHISLFLVADFEKDTIRKYPAPHPRTTFFRLCSFPTAPPPEYPQTTGGNRLRVRIRQHARSRVRKSFY
jgi:choline kinase